MPQIVKTSKLWTTEVGSRMWGMQEYASDYDCMKVYIQNTESLLRGYRLVETKPSEQYVDSKGREIDNTYMELGHLIGLLMKGNINAVWAVTSPVVRNNSPHLGRLKSIVERNLSKASYHSIRGMAESQLLDAWKRKEVRDPGKSVATAARTVQFGIRMMLDKKLEYLPPTGDLSIETVRESFGDLEKAWEYSNLPVEVDQTEFRDYLYGMRLMEL